MKLFLDTNILIDLLGRREPFSKWAYQIFLDQKRRKWRLYTSSYSILTCYYIIERELGTQKAKQGIKILLSRVEIESITKFTLEKSLITKFKDYEDAVQHECALQVEKVDMIITRNKKDFRNSLIPVMSSEELYSI